VNEIEVHQCLYGYQDGHRLLSSSLRLPQEAASTLLLLSDLAPGLSLPIGKGYWTGVPLLSIKCYALMYTWLAPEMSRPGCVWSHVLIISFADMARFSDLSVLMGQVKRPTFFNGFDDYSVTLSLIPPGDFFGPLSPVSLEREKVHRVIRCIYSESGKGRVIGAIGEFDSVVFAVWSQQWPRLRRRFSFRTAISSADMAPSKIAFDLSVVRDSENKRDAGFEFVDIEPWERLAVEDVLFPRKTDFRRFLWRYGSDLRMGYRRFKFLSQLYILTRKSYLGPHDTHRILQGLSVNLPSLEEGKMLKSDLLQKSKYSMFPTLDSIAVLDFYTSFSGMDFLPELDEGFFDRILLEWDERFEEILSVAEVASQKRTYGSDKFLSKVVPLIKPAKLLALTKERPHLRKYFLTSNPALLDSDALLAVNGNQLTELIDYIPEKNEALVRRVLKRLLVVNDDLMAAVIMDRFPKLAVEVVVGAIEKAFLRGHLDLPRAWVDQLVQRAHSLIEGGYVESSKTTAALNFYSSMMSCSSPNVLRAGPKPWAEGIRNARDNLGGLERQKFLCFLLELALRKPLRGSEELFEFTFFSIHEDLRYSALDSELAYNLLKRLPTLSWLSNWDNCLRLRVGVLDAYISGSLDINSFKRLGYGKLNEQMRSLLKASKDNDG